MTALLLEAREVAAAYDGRTVFAGLSLQLGAGLCALQGANGSGKSTLLRVLAGAHAPAAGEVVVAGKNLAGAPEAAKRQLAYVPDESPIYPFMTGRDLLAFVAAVKRVPLDDAVDSAIAGLGLLGQMETRFDALSFGTQKKLLLAAAIIGAPRLLLLDEPSNGLDAAARQWLVGALQQMGRQAAVLWATHDDALIAETGAQVVTMADLAATRAR